MATNNLFTPILNDRTRSVNFFNGRLLTGEDLTSEQKANRVAHALLGQAVGSGVVYGLTVSESTQLSSVQTPVVTIRKGLAINPNGAALLLDNDTDISLVRPASSASSSSIFQECTPIQPGVYIAGAGVYLLVMGPASASQGLAEVSGINTGSAPCNSKYRADGVQFRLVPVDLTLTELGDVNHLRNLVAYKCFGGDDWAADVTDPFGTHTGGHGLIDQMRAAGSITGCEVPLAVMYWTATGGLLFIDLWSVRRSLTRSGPDDSSPIPAVGKPQSEGRARFRQFQEQLAAMRTALAAPQSVTVTDYFRYLPPMGLLPLTGTAQGVGFGYQEFFAGQTTRGPFFINESRVRWALETFVEFPPIDLNTKELIWLYLIPSNAQQGNTPGGPLPYLIFAGGQVPYQGNSRYDVSHWNYSNYSLVAGEGVA
ncbi:MAG TPA: hypothetical protein VKU19_37165 [Bryobacteraceae bacterium]|nr:hypothetical protein [Bryobacteraceae bacterium]